MSTRKVLVMKKISLEADRKAQIEASLNNPQLFLKRDPRFIFLQNYTDIKKTQKAVVNKKYLNSATSVNKIEYKRTISNVSRLSHTPSKDLPKKENDKIVSNQHIKDLFADIKSKSISNRNVSLDRNFPTSLVNVLAKQEKVIKYRQKHLRMEKVMANKISEITKNPTRLLEKKRETYLVKRDLIREKESERLMRTLKARDWFTCKQE